MRVFEFPWKRAASELRRKMRADWDARAGEDYKLHIATGHSSSDEMFRESGKKDLEVLILDGIDLDPAASALEIGCGVGRLLVPLSERIARVRGVDISPVMVEKSRGYCAGRKNVHVELTDGTLRNVASGSLDFAFSFIVFQHIPGLVPIRAYVREVARCLRPGGVFRFQVDGRWEKFRDRPPDTYEGVKLSPSDVRELLRGTGLTILEEWGEETHYHRVTVRRGEAACPGAGLRPRRYDPRILALLFSRLGFEDAGERARLVTTGRSGIRRQLGPVEERWAGTDDETFVREVARCLLGCEMDEEGVRYHVKILEGKFEDRSALLDTIMTGLQFADIVRPFVRPVPWYRIESIRLATGVPQPAEASAEGDLFTLADAVEGILSEGPADEFVRSASLLVRGEAPDAETLAHYLGVVAGSSWGRRLVVRDLVGNVDEGVVPPAPSRRVMDRIAAAMKVEIPSRCVLRQGESFPGEARVAASLLHEFRALSDRPFLEAAYGRILGRTADEEGAAYYSGKLANRELDRVRVVRELLWSDELRAP